MAEEKNEDDDRRKLVVPLWAVLAVGLVLLAGVVLGIQLSGDDESKPAAKASSGAQTVRFQKPADPGPEPFTEPAEREGSRTVSFTPSSPGGGPFGGSGSNAVCDRDRLIRFLRDNPERMRAWAEALGVTPTFSAVRRYIARLHPVTLVRDTRVTNHTFSGGRAVGFQSILAAGTAVLVDDYGKPVVRCRCGNPLTEPVYVPTATCYGCPPHYTPPKEICTYWRRTTTYRRTWYPGGYYSNTTYDEVFIRRTRRGPYDDCWKAYPDPPTVTIVDVYQPEARPPTTTAPGATQAGYARAAFSPAAGTQDDTYTLSVAGFRPNSTLSILLVRPDGVRENYSLTTNSAGSGSYTFPRVDNAVTGTYVATITGGGRTARASTTVSPSRRDSSPAPQTQTHTNEEPYTGAPGEILQCDPPRSQLEFEECAALEQQQQGGDGSTTTHDGSG